METNYQSKKGNDARKVDPDYSVLMLGFDRVFGDAVQALLENCSLPLIATRVVEEEFWAEPIKRKSWDAILLADGSTNVTIRSVIDAFNLHDVETNIIVLAKSIDVVLVSEMLRLNVSDIVAKDQITSLVPAIRRMLEKKKRDNSSLSTRTVQTNLDDLVGRVRALSDELEQFSALSLELAKTLFHSPVLNVSSLAFYFEESETTRHLSVVSENKQYYRNAEDLSPVYQRLMSYSEVESLGPLRLLSNCKDEFISAHELENSCYMMLPLAPLRVNREGSFVLLSFDSYTDYKSVDLKVYTEIARLVSNVTALFLSRIRQLRLERAVEMSPMPIIMTDENGVIEYVNQAVVDSRGYDRHEIIGNNPSMFKSGKTSPVVYQNLWQTVRAGEQWKGEVQNRKKNGQLTLEKINIFPVKNDYGSIINYVAMYEDIADLKRHQRRLDYMTSHDSVTGLINQQIFSDRVAQVMINPTQSHCGICVVCVSIVNFKNFNEKYGFHQSNIVFKLIAQQLKSALNLGESIARGSGAEMLILLPNKGEEESARKRFAEIMSHLDGCVVHQSISEDVELYAGAVVVQDNKLGLEPLLVSAQGALYDAKNRDIRNQLVFTKSYIQGLDVSRSQLIEKLDYAIENDELVLFYQPQVNAQTGILRGCEALVRWQSPEFGFMPPDSFIPLAEVSDQIIALGDVVLEKSIQQLAAWKPLLPKDFSMSINLSTKQLREGRLIPRLESLIAQHEVNPESLEFEITESSIIENIEETLIVLKQIRALGCTVSIDDFGTGYSNLSYLRQIPLDVLKIDRCFIDQMTQVEEDALLAKMIIQLAQTMGLKVVAEGVETDAQSNMLAKLRCDYLQGFYYSKPIPAIEFEEVLRNPVMKVNDSNEQDLLLIIDDERHILSALRRLFKRTGIKVMTTLDPYEALDILAKHKVGVILSDHRMPEMLGTELLRKVKKMHPETVRIMLSGYTDVDTLSKAVNEGAIYKFIHKPWEDDVLVNEIEKAFTVYQRQLE